jgi:hypothetical protein
MAKRPTPPTTPPTAANPPLALVPPVASTPAPSERQVSPVEQEAFNARELAYIAARASGRTIKNSAQAAKPPYPYSTARVLDDREDVRRELRKRAREAVECGVRTLATASSVAAKALADVAERGGTGDAPRVSAARACLELSIQSLKIDDIAERVEQLEAAQGKQPGNAGFRRT